MSFHRFVSSFFSHRRRAQARDGIHLISSSGGRNGGPPDLDEMWRDFTRRFNRMMGRPKGPHQSPKGDGDGPRFSGEYNLRIGWGLITGVVVLIWLASGFFIVQEGQKAVITSFGRYHHTAEAGFQWHFPYPFQAHETVDFTQLRSVEVGRNSVVQATGLRDSSMLTQDENIVDIRFTVQFRLKDARDFLFQNRDPEEAVQLAAESAVREVVGKSKIDLVLYVQRDAIATELVKSIQLQLDRLKAGITISNVNMQSVQPPEQVQAAFDDTLKAGQDGDRLKKEGQAYASDIIPKAQGTAARLRQEAQGYSAKVVAQAEGDARRFTQVLTEYQKAPTVTRDRLYIDAMQQIYANVTKVMVDSKASSNLMYLPLDRLLEQASASTQAASAGSAATAPVNADVSPANSSGGAVDIRSREGLRGRDRDGR
jgi:modulator of FtsH protease HflK